MYLIVSKVLPSPVSIRTSPSSSSFTNCAASVAQLYAFFYVPNPPLPTSNGWSVYSPREEFGRMGVGTRSKAWRFTDLNKDYPASVQYGFRCLRVDSKRSSAPRIPPASSYPRESVTPHCSTLQSIGASVAYPPWSICTGLILYDCPPHFLPASLIDIISGYDNQIQPTLGRNYQQSLYTR